MQRNIIWLLFFATTLFSSCTTSMPSKRGTQNRVCQIDAKFDHLWEVVSKSTFDKINLQALNRYANAPINPGTQPLEGYEYTGFGWYSNQPMIYQEVLYTRHPNYRVGDRTYVFNIDARSINCLPSSCQIGEWRNLPDGSRWYREIKCRGPRYANIRYHQYAAGFLEGIISQYRQYVTGNYSIQYIVVPIMDANDAGWFSEHLSQMGFVARELAQTRYEYSRNGQPTFVVEMADPSGARVRPLDLFEVGGVK